MPDCCSPNTESTSVKRHVCPKNNKQYTEVPYATVLHHVKQAWNFSAEQETFYFCSDPDCEVVYFSLEGIVLNKKQLRTKVGIKETFDDSLICYCFGVNRQQAATDKAIKAFVIQQTKNNQCACSTYNPSGRCCLKDFAK